MTNEPTMIHVFEKAGLGKAPFRVIGVEERRGPIQTGPNTFVGAPGQPMGCCQYCFTGIVECWKIQSADGRTFIVGCDCVRKTGDKGLKTGMAPHLLKMRHAAEKRRIDAARLRLADPAVRAALSAQDHPLDWRKAMGETLLHWAEWMMQNAGNAGRIAVARRHRQQRG